MFYARPTQSGYEYRCGGEILPGDIPLSADEFDALLDERATIENEEVVML